MDTVLNGKALVFTDIHVGLKTNSTSRLAIAIRVFKHLIETVKKNDIKYCLFGGDLFHERVSINVNTMNAALKCISALAKHCKVYLVVGNHDIHYKNSVDVNALNMFKDTPNVFIVQQPTQIMLNGKSMILAPWLSDLSQFKEETFDFALGHFDISSDFLVANYVEEHVKKTQSSDTVKKMLEVNSLLNSNQMTADSSIKRTLESNISPAADKLGYFVDIVKRGGTVFSGHIHCHKEMVSRGRHFIFVGTPYEQNLGDLGHECGYYIIDEDCSYHFCQTPDIPKHVNLRMSEIVKSFDTYDFQKIRGNIVHKIYDCDVDRLVDSKISQKINDFKPYEELIPDYDVDIAYGNDVQLQNESIDLIKKSKLDYIKNYIDNIDKKALEDDKLEADELFSVLEKYYQLVTEEK